MPTRAGNFFGVAAACLVALTVKRYMSPSENSAESTIDGIAFPTELHSNGVQQRLYGGGTRFKYNVVKVYAVGLYADAAAHSGELKAFAGKPLGELKKSKFFAALGGSKFAKTLLLQFHRSVGADTVAGAMRDSLAKRLKAEPIAKFSAALVKVLGGTSIPTGGQLYFSCKGDSMTVAFGQLRGGEAVKAKGVCAAFFDVYLGSSPISPQAKDAIAAAFVSAHPA